MKPPAVPGQREPDGQGIAVELGAGRVALVRAALQESVLVAVQVVYEVAVAAVLGDDVDGSCRGTGSGTAPGLRPAFRAAAWKGSLVGWPRGFGTRLTPVLFRLL